MSGVLLSCLMTLTVGNPLLTTYCSVVLERQECQPTHPCQYWRPGTLPLPSQGNTRNSSCKVNAKGLWYLEDRLS